MEDGEFDLPPLRRSLMNSLPWIGKILGCMFSDTFIERLGYKKTMYVIGVVQIAGIICQSPISR